MGQTVTNNADNFVDDKITYGSSFLFLFKPFPIQVSVDERKICMVIATLYNYLAKAYFVGVRYATGTPYKSGAQIVQRTRLLRWSSSSFSPAKKVNDLRSINEAHDLIICIRLWEYATHEAEKEG